MKKALQAFESKVTFYGDFENGFFGSIEDNCSGSDVGLRECPFCKGTHQLIQNTHSDSYWITCACGVELQSSHMTEDGGSYCDLECGGSFFTEDACRIAHQAAFIHIINKWNTLGVS